MDQAGPNNPYIMMHGNTKIKDIDSSEIANYCLLFHVISKRSARNASCIVTAILKPEKNIIISSTDEICRWKAPTSSGYRWTSEKCDAEGLNPGMCEKAWVIHNISITKYSRVTWKSSNAPYLGLMAKVCNLIFLFHSTAQPYFYLVAFINLNQ